jgi:hypothetical protein
MDYDNFGATGSGWQMNQLTHKKKSRAMPGTSFLVRLKISFLEVHHYFNASLSRLSFIIFPAILSAFIS